MKKIWVVLVLSTMMAAQSKKSQKNECAVGSDLGLDSPAGVYACQNGKWVFDAKATQVERDERYKFYKHREDLYHALRTRVLTPAEEKEAYRMGDSLHEPCDGSGSGCTYSDDDKVAASRELNDAWYQQRRLQMLAKLGMSCSGGIAIADGAGGAQ